MPLKYAEAARDAYAFPLLIRHLLNNSLASARDNPIVSGSQRFTYTKFLDRVSRLAEALTSLAASDGTTIAVMDWDSHHYLECFFAIPMLGAVLQMVNVRLSRDQIEYTLRHARAEILLVHRDFQPMIVDMRAKLPHVREVVFLGDDPTDERGDLEYEALLAAGRGAFEFPDFDEHALATTFYTTGTTGTPKAVCFSHRQVVLHTLAITAALAAQPAGYGLGRDDVYLPLTPMFHVHAWGFPYIATMLGLKQVYPGRFDPRRVVSLIEREHVTFSHGVPTILQKLLEVGRDLPGLKLLIGGSVLTEQLHEAARKQGVRTFAAYGMSECCPVLTVSRNRPGASDGRDLCQAGYAAPLVALRIDRSHDALPPAAGEVLARAPWLTRSYCGEGEASAALWQGGWLHTQDVGRVEEGILTITDRLKDVIKTGGEWVSSLEIEALVAKHPSVLEAAVVGLPDPTWGERPVVAVVPRNGEYLDLASVKAFLEPLVAAGTIGAYAVPDRVVVMDALPRTSVGKVDKKELRRRLGESTQCV
jgi:fatty-acyl-CoA synthase